MKRTQKKAFILEHLQRIDDPKSWEPIHVFLTTAKRLEEWAKRQKGLFKGLSREFLTEIIVSRGHSGLGYRLLEVPLSELTALR